MVAIANQFANQTASNTTGSNDVSTGSDGFTDLTRNRMFKSIEVSYRNLEPFRNINRELVKEYAGPGYGQPIGRKDDYIGLMNQTVEAYMMLLVANRPRVMVSTENPYYRYFARHFQTALNNLIKEIGLEYTLQRWVLDAFFSVGVVKVHLADSAPVQLEQHLWIDPGKPFVSNVSLDNFVFDGSAKTWGEVKYAGDMYRVPFSSLRTDLYDQEAAKDVTPTSKYSGTDERLEQISRGSEVDDDEFEPMVDLADIWIPAQRKIFTYAATSRENFQLNGRPLAEMDDRLEDGPYQLLGFAEVPENIMPSSLSSHLSMLSRLTNNLFRKQAKRAKETKRNHTYSPAEADTVARIMKSGDDAWIKANDPKDIGEVNIGGVDPQLQAFILGAMEVYDRQAGNLTAMLGLGAQADTVGQEQLIRAAGSRREAKLQYKVVDATTQLITSLGKLLWMDAAKVIPGEIQIDGAAGYSVDATWTPEYREGRFIDYELSIDVFSMAYQTPGQKGQTITQIVTQVLAPLMPVLMSQGGSINMQEFVDILSELLPIPELRRIVQFSTMPLDPSGMGGDEGMSMTPDNSTRTYIRRNVPSGGTPQSRSQVMQQAWMGGGSNTPQQVNQMSREAA